jgi:hypothetical protein
MAHVQMQIVRRYCGGVETVVFATDVDLRDNHDYTEEERRLARHCDDSEYVRTVGEGSPFRVSLSQETEE